MKLLLDENVSHTTTQRLRDVGFDVVHVLDAGLQGRSDERVMSTALKERRIIVTHDKDFGNVLRFPLQKHQGIIMMRFHNQSPRAVVPYLLNFLSKHTQQQLRARLVILREDGWRIV